MSDPAERGRDALARGAWDEARGCFEQALERSDSAEAWDGLSWACWWLEDEAAAMQAREHAYRLYKDAGDRQGAARMAIWLANDHLDFRGEAAVAQGWFRRHADPGCSRAGAGAWLARRPRGRDGSGEG